MRKNHKHLHEGQIVKLEFTPAPFVSFSTECNLCSHLIRFKLYPFQHTTASYKSNTTGCQVGKNVTFGSHVAKETFKIF